MIPLCTREVARGLDVDAVERLKLPSIVLMENAGLGAFEFIRSQFAELLKRVAVVGGVGQNGGDAWVVARHLFNAGFTPRCVLVGDRAKVRGDAAVNLNALELLGVTVANVHERSLSGAFGSPLDAPIRDATLIIDGLFGTGLDREVTGVNASVIKRLNSAAAPCIALDIPSGVDADSGKILGVAVEARATVTFACHKRGLHQHPGAKLAGRLHLVSIGVPAPKDAPWSQLEAADVVGWLPPRGLDAHKGVGGHVLVIAGAPGRTGAAVLSGLGALRSGAGLVTLCPRHGAQSSLDGKVIELMTADLPASIPSAIDFVKSEMEKKHAAVVGPGLGLDDDARQLVKHFALELEKPCVLDADALTIIGTELGDLKQAKAPRVLTPHPAEAARLLGITTAEVQADRYAAATKLAAVSGQVTVLKGARTLIAHPDGRGHVCPLDVPALAVAGTGDVLTGVIAALLPGLAPFEAASAAVYLHARAGALAARADRGLFAHEVADAVPLALTSCRESA
ncbi:MAG TPA: NAD(P)H-hydrate dehydratase [Polyangiales bacterium]|nr:NAD(P)H-hydrate dehydratase [Polyangiales bacterium]